jgi:hypothetical protein
VSPAELLEIDQHLDAVLRAAGSALRYHTMQKGLDDMRAAMRAAMEQPVNMSADIKPPDERSVLAWDGERWVRAIWVAKHSKEQFGHDGDWCDYNEADDTYYWPEGWYEVQTHGGDEMFWHLPNGAQVWREMPVAPALRVMGEVA